MVFERDLLPSEASNHTKRGTLKKSTQLTVSMLFLRHANVDKTSEQYNLLLWVTFTKDLTHRIEKVKQH